MKALVLVHPSSLDSYASEVGRDLGIGLGDMLTQSAIGHSGPVWILWDESMAGPIAQRFAVAVERERPDSRWIEHSDAAVGDWKRLEAELPRELGSARVKTVILGGIWYDEDLEHGCATEVYLILKRKLRGMKVEVDTNLTGMEDDA